LWNDWIYASASAYVPLSRNINNAIGPTPVGEADIYDGIIPFWHVGLQHDFFHHEHYFELGAFGTTADRYPRGDKSSGLKDHISDVAVEANYQWLADLHNMVSWHATYIRENQDLNATNALGNSDRSSVNTTEFRTDLTYTIDDTYVPSIQYFQSRGSHDATFWGTGNGSPNSQGYVIDLAYVPFGKSDSPGYNWGNMRVALQYTGYTEYAGTTNHASDNNTIFLSLWFALAPFTPIYSHDTATN
jgi:hypothetical protein